MAYIPSHQTLRNHPKLKRLARKLSISDASAIGHLHLFWWWALDYAPGGSLNGHDHLDIAIGAGWEGDEHELIDALIDCGFVDNIDGLKVHDWDEYGGQYQEKLTKDRERKRKEREERRNSNGTPSLSNGRPKEIGGTARQGEERKEEKSREEEQNTPQPPKGERVRPIKPTDLTGFEEFYELFPRHVGRDPAEKAWAKLSHDERTAAIAAIREQITWSTFTDVPPDKIPHPTTWLNQRRWTDEPPKPSNVQPIRPVTRPQLPPVMQPGHVPKDGGLAAWRNAGNSGGT